MPQNTKQRDQVYTFHGFNPLNRIKSKRVSRLSIHDHLIVSASSE